jgi:hypothetical protein
MRLVLKTLHRLLSWSRDVGRFALVVAAAILTLPASAEAIDLPVTEDFAPIREAGWQSHDGEVLNLRRGLTHGDVNFAWSAEGANAVRLGGRGGTKKLVLEVDQRAGSLHFLHTLEPGDDTQAYQRAAVEAKERGDKPEDLPTIATYRVVYADGQTVDAKVRWDESIHDISRDRFWDRTYGMFGHLAWADIAAFREIAGEPGRVQTLYAMRWPNPRPGETIARIEAVPADGDFGRVILLGAAIGEKLDAGPVIFVSPDGDDDHPGTFGQPKADPIAAMAALQPGETLYIRGGEYRPTQRLKAVLKGTMAKPIRIVGYPGETAILDARDYLFTNDPDFAGVTDRSPFASRNGFLHLDGSTHTTVYNLHLQNLISIGVCVIGVDHVAVEHNTFFRAPASAIYLTGQNSRANHNLAIRPCWRDAVDHHIAFDDARQNDPILQAQKTYLDNRRIRGGFGDEGIDVGGTGSNHLEGAYNEVCWSDKEAMDVKGGPQNIRIHHNHAHHNNFWVALYIDGWTKPLRNVQMHHNVSHDNWGIGLAVNVEHGPIVENIHVHNNLSFNNGLAGMNSGGAGDDNFRRNIVIEHNTFANNGNQGWKHGHTGGVNISSENVAEIYIRRNVFTDSRDYHIAVFGPDYAQKGISIEENLLHPKLESGWLGDKQDMYAIDGQDPMYLKPQYADVEAGNFRLVGPAADLGVGAYHPVDPPSWAE